MNQLIASAVHLWLLRPVKGKHQCVVIMMRIFKFSHFKRQKDIKISQKLWERERERDVISDTDVTFFIMTFSLIHVKNQSESFQSQQVWCMRLPGSPCLMRTVKRLIQQLAQYAETNRITNCNTMNLPASVRWYNAKILLECKAVVLCLRVRIPWGVMGCFARWKNVSELQKCKIFYLSWTRLEFNISFWSQDIK